MLMVMRLEFFLNLLGQVGIIGKSLLNLYRTLNLIGLPLYGMLEQLSTALLMMIFQRQLPEPLSQLVAKLITEAHFKVNNTQYTSTVYGDNQEQLTLILLVLFRVLQETLQETLRVERALMELLRQRCLATTLLPITIG